MMLCGVAVQLKRLCCAALCAALSVAAAGQTPAAPAQTNLKIKKTTRLVEVDVVVKDGKGQPVTGLTAKDFTLRDNGQPQTISRFSVEQNGSLQPALVESTGSAAPAATPTSTVATNTNSSNIAAIVILLDLLNTPQDNQAALKKQLLASLHKLQSSAPIALLVLGENLQVVSDFTTNNISLANALEAQRGTTSESFGPPITAPRTANEKFNMAILRAAVPAFLQQQREQTNRTLLAFQIIRKHLERIRGRKSLVWLSGGLQIPTSEAQLVHQEMARMNDANVAIYTVDARGVTLGFDANAAVDTTDQIVGMMEQEHNTRNDILDTIAANTGGVAYRNTNKLDVAITQAIEDNDLVYSLSYYPTDEKFDGKFHKLTVQVAEPGVRLRYRSGYLAVAEPEPPPQPAGDPVQDQLRAVATSSLENPAIRFTVQVKHGEDPQTADLVLSVPASELQFTEQDGKQTDELQMWFIQRRATGDDLLTTNSKLPLSLTPEMFAGIQKQGLSFGSRVKLSEGAARVRVMLRDVNSGKIGSVDVALDSPAAARVQ